MFDDYVKCRSDVSTIAVRLRLPNLRLHCDAHIFCWHVRPLARERNTCSDMLLSAGEGIVLPGLLFFACHSRTGRTLTGPIINYKILSLTAIGTSPDIWTNKGYIWTHSFLKTGRISRIKDNLFADTKTWKNLPQQIIWWKFSSNVAQRQMSQSQIFSKQFTRLITLQLLLTCQ